MRSYMCFDAKGPNTAVDPEPVCFDAVPLCDTDSADTDVCCESVCAGLGELEGLLDLDFSDLVA